MRTLKSIIDEVDVLVPNPIDVANKVIWLNSINKEFFEFVKIPTLHTFVTTSSAADYTVPADIRSRNVDQLLVGGSFYRSAQYEDVNPGHNQWVLDEATKKLQLIPTPTTAGLRGMIRYSKTSSTIFSATTLTVTPDAPEEYHDAYVLGLCERVAKAMNDVALANNYGRNYRERLLSAQQTFGASTQTGSAAE